MLIRCAYLGTLVSVDPDPISQSMVRRIDYNNIQGVVEGTGSLLFKSFVFGFVIFIFAGIFAFIVPINDIVKKACAFVACVALCLSGILPFFLGSERRFQNNLDMHLFADLVVRLESAFAVEPMYERKIENTFHALLDVNVINFFAFYATVFSTVCVGLILILVTVECIMRSKGVDMTEYTLFISDKLGLFERGKIFRAIAPLLSFVLCGVIFALVSYFVNKDDVYQISDKAFLTIQDAVRSKANTRFFHAQFGINGVSSDGLDGTKNVNAYAFNFQVLFVFVLNLFFCFSIVLGFVNNGVPFAQYNIPFTCLICIIGGVFGYTICKYFLQKSAFVTSLFNDVQKIQDGSLPCKVKRDVKELKKVVVKSSRRFSMHPFTMELVYQDVDGSRYFLSDIIIENDGRQEHVVPENWDHSLDYLFDQKFSYNLEDDELFGILSWMVDSIRYGDLRIGEKYTTDQIIDIVQKRKMGVSVSNRFIGGIELSEVYYQMCLQFFRHDVVLFSGNTGSGKSTSLNRMHSLDGESLDTTEYHYADGTIGNVREDGFVYGSLLRQQPDELAIMLTLNQILSFIERMNPESSEIRTTCMRLLRESGLYQTYVENPDASISDLMRMSSGGQRQQWAVIVFLVECMSMIKPNGNARIYGFDESVSSIDRVNSEKIIREILRILLTVKDGSENVRNTIILVLHNFEPLANVMADIPTIQPVRWLVLDGRIRLFAPDGYYDYLFSTNNELIADIYTKAVSEE